MTKINELIFWPTQILGVVRYLECPAGYGRTEQIISSESKVVRGLLINKSKAAVERGLNGLLIERSWI